MPLCHILIPSLYFTYCFFLWVLLMFSVVSFRVTDALCFLLTAFISTVIRHRFLFSSPQSLLLTAFMRGGKMMYSSEVKLRERPSADRLNFYLTHRDPFERQFFFFLTWLSFMLNLYAREELNQMPHISCWSDSSYSTSHTIVSQMGRESGRKTIELDSIQQT